MTKREAMQYVYRSQNGYVEDIKQKIGQENFKALTLLGFVKRGKESSNRDSWKSTNSLEQFLKPYNTEVSFFDKIRFYLNNKIG
jgi:hypothetical protein